MFDLYRLRAYFDELSLLYDSMRGYYQDERLCFDSLPFSYPVCEKWEFDDRLFDFGLLLADLEDALEKLRSLMDASEVD